MLKTSNNALTMAGSKNTPERSERRTNNGRRFLIGGVAVGAIGLAATAIFPTSVPNDVIPVTLQVDCSSGVSQADIADALNADQLRVIRLEAPDGTAEVRARLGELAIDDQGFRRYPAGSEILNLESAILIAGSPGITGQYTEAERTITLACANAASTGTASSLGGSQPWNIAI
jgi:hypothetical protein